MAFGLMAVAAVVQASSANTAALEPTVMIVEFVDRPEYVGQPAACSDEEGSICFAELHEGRIRILRRLTGPPIPSGQLLRLISHHLPILSPIMIVATRPFEDKGTTGNFALRWEPLVAPGTHCVSDEDYRSWSADDPLRRAFSAAKTRHFRPANWDEAADFRCITD